MQTSEVGRAEGAAFVALDPIPPLSPRARWAGSRHGPGQRPPSASAAQGSSLPGCSKTLAARPLEGSAVLLGLAGLSRRFHEGDLRP